MTFIKPFKKSTRFYLSSLAITLGGALSLVQIRKYFNGEMCTNSHDMAGKTVLITGGNRGIGKETAKDLAKRGAKVILASRSSEMTLKTVQEIKNESKNDQLESMQLDLSDLNSVRSFVEAFKAKHDRLDVLVNNAGVYEVSYKQTKDGYESNFGINHLGHFLLTNLLLPTLLASPQARVVNVSSRAHLRSPPLDLSDYHSPKTGKIWDSYPKSKLANVLFTKEFARRQDPKKIKFVCLHPGVVNTSIFDSVAAQFSGGAYFLNFFYPLMYIFAKDEVHGAQTTLTCCYEDFDKLSNGAYYKDNRIEESSILSNNAQAARDLWEYSLKVVGL